MTSGHGTDALRTGRISILCPGVVVAECLYVLCKKREDNTLSPTEHAAAVSDLGTSMGMILPPPQGDRSLIARAEQRRSGYGCSRSADGLDLCSPKNSQCGPR